MQNIVVLTGAGLSAESGLPTFRDENGVWLIEDVEAVASIAGWRRDPQRVLDFYNPRRDKLDSVHPNDAHVALAKLQKAISESGGRFTLITQNIDDLHERGGAADVIHMHGELRKQRCHSCNALSAFDAPITRADLCAKCGKAGSMRPHVVWFGEVPLGMDACFEAIAAADLFVSIGTSGAVQPAASFVAIAREGGAHTLEINLKPSETAGLFAEARYGPASQVVTDWAWETIAGLPAPEGAQKGAQG
jgi:NAD-dependent deacetylase